MKVKSCPFSLPPPSLPLALRITVSHPRKEPAGKGEGDVWSVEGVFGAEMTDQPPAPQFHTELLQARPVLKGRVANQLMKESCQERGERSPYLRSGWRSQVLHNTGGVCRQRE